MGVKGVKIEIPAQLRPVAGSAEAVEVNGTTVGECLDELVKRFPGAAEQIFDASGRLPGYIAVYVNDELVESDELARPVKNGDRIHLPYIITGG